MRMSSGLTVPLLARLSVRISVIVITMVTSTTSVAPKLRASSLRREEWNSIGARRVSREKPGIMDFELKTLGLAEAARARCDALVVIVPDAFTGAGDPLSRLVEQARRDGH